MKKTVKSKLIAIAIVLFSASAMAKDEVHNEQVHFDRGTNGITVQDSIKGYATVNYKLAANSGQLMRLSLQTSNASAYFNIFVPGKAPGDGAMFIGSTEGNSYVGILPSKGTYTIQIYIMRNAARRKETANYKLNIEID